MGVFNKSIKRASSVQHALEAVRDGEQALYIDPSRIRCGRQTRKENNPGFSPESLSELGESIKRNGQSEPAVLRPDPEGIAEFLMVAGERRYRACKLFSMPLLSFVRDLTNEQARDVQLAENIQREDLTPLEIAEELQQDYEELGTLDLVAKKWGKSINWIHERLKFLKAVSTDGIARQAVEAGLTSDVSTVNDLAKLEKQDPAAAKKLVDEASVNPSINLRNAARQGLRRAKAPEQPTTPTSGTAEARTAPSAASLHDERVQANDGTSAAIAPALRSDDRKPRMSGTRDSNRLHVSESDGDGVELREPSENDEGHGISFAEYVDALGRGAIGRVRHRESAWRAFCEDGELAEKFGNLEGLLARLAAAGIPRIEVETGNLNC